MRREATEETAKTEELELLSNECDAADLRRLLSIHRLTRDRGERGRGRADNNNHSRIDQILQQAFALIDLETTTEEAHRILTLLNA